MVNKRYALFMAIIIVIMNSLPSLSQTQNGVIKQITHNTDANDRLSDVYVSVDKHNTVKSDSLGKFEIELHGYLEGDSFIIKDVKKPGYALQNTTDLGVHPFSSKVELPIYMYSIREKHQEQKKIYDRWNSLLEENVGRIRDSLMTELENAHIDNDRLQELLAEVDDYYSKSQNLFKTLSQHYALLNYEEMSEWEIQLSQYVEQGQFALADSMINEVGIENLYVEAQNAQNDKRSAAEIYKAAEKEAERKTQQAIQAMLAKHTVAIDQMDYTSAVDYMYKIVSLDSTNIDHLLLLSNELFIIGQYDSAIDCAQRIQRIARKLSSRISLAEGILAEGQAVLAGYKDSERSGNIFFRIIEELYPDINQAGFAYEDSLVLCRTFSCMAHAALLSGEYALAEKLISNAYAFGDQVFKNQPDSYSNSEWETIIGVFDSYLTYLFHRGDYDGIIRVLDDNYYENIPSLFDVYYALAYSGKNKAEKAIYYANRALQVANTQYKENQNIRLLAYIALANSNLCKGDYDKAKQYVDSARISYSLQSIQDTTSYLTMLNQMGVVCYNQRKYEDAIAIFKEELQIMNNADWHQEPFYSLVMYNIAQNYVEINELDSALHYHNQALEIRQKLLSDNIYTHTLAESYAGYAYLYAKKKNYMQAHMFYEEACQVQSKVSIDYADRRFYQNMALYYLLEAKKDTTICNTKEFKKYYSQYTELHIYCFYSRERLGSVIYPIFELDGEYVGDQYVYEKSLRKKYKTALVYSNDAIELHPISDFDQYSLIYMLRDSKYKKNILKKYKTYKKSHK